MKTKGRVLGSIGMLVSILLLSAHPVRASEGGGQLALEPVVTQEESEQITSASSLFENDPRAAIGQLRAQTGPDASAALDFALAAMLAKAESFVEAEKALDAALDKFPSFQRAWLLMARVMVLQGKTRRALDPLRKTVELGGDPTEAFKLLAYCHMANGHAVSAESAYRQVLVFGPTDKEAIAGLARSLLMQERAEDAAPLLGVLCERDPSKSEYWQLRASAELDRGENHRAIVLLECARQMSEVDQQSLLALGDLYFNEGLHERATSCYSEAATGGALSTDSLVRYAEALLDAGEPVLAEKLVGRELSEDRSHPERLHVVRARIALARGDSKSARAHLDAALSERPLSGDALFTLARIQEEGNELEQALLTLERVSRIESHRRRALLAIARIYVDRSQYPKALDALEEAQLLQFDPHVARYVEQIHRVNASRE